MTCPKRECLFWKQCDHKPLRDYLCYRNRESGQMDDTDISVVTAQTDKREAKG